MGGGFTHAELSPREDRILFLHSSIARPDEVWVQAARPGAEAKQVTQTRTLLFLAQDWNIPEIVPVPSTHNAGAPVYARVFTPKDFGLTEIMGSVVDVVRAANGLDDTVPEPA